MKNSLSFFLLIFFLNTSRGEIVNTKDLVKNLKSGKIIGAGLDVLEFENKSFDYRFLLSKHVNNSNNFIYGLFINKKIKDFNLGISIANNFKNQSSSQISFGYNF